MPGSDYNDDDYYPYYYADEDQAGAGDGWYDDYDWADHQDYHQAAPQYHYQPQRYDSTSDDAHHRQVAEYFPASSVGGYNYETYVPIVADYFDKNLHYDATHYLYEPENLSELLNAPVDEHSKQEAIQAIITQVEEDLVPLLPGGQHDQEEEKVEQPSVVATLTEALIQGVVKAEAEAEAEATAE